MNAAPIRRALTAIAREAWLFTLDLAHWILHPRRWR
jgi:hypothetical protein